MAEASQPFRDGGGTGNSLEFLPNAPLPNWLLSPDEIGYEIVLVMQVRQENQSQEQRQNKPHTTLPSPFVIGASVEQLIGQQEAKKVNASKENRGTRYLLRTNSYSTANKLLTITELIDGTTVEVFAHSSLNSVQGLVYEPDSINDDENDIRNYLKSQGVINVRRIRKRVNGILRNTPLLVLTLKGAVLPKAVRFGLLQVEIRTYYPSPLLCYNCGVYGHPKKICKQLSICLRCSQHIHVAEGEQCQNPPFCLHCKANHSTISRDCPVYQQEVKIVKHKTDNRVSFVEARRMLRETSKDSYASVLQQRLDQVELEKDTIIRKLRMELDTLKAELELLKEASQMNDPQVKNKHTTTVQKSSSHCCNSKEIHKITPNDSSHANSTTSIPRNNEKESSSSVNSNSRKSRKDKPFKSPPKNHTHVRGFSSLRAIETRSRSRSDKRTYTPLDNEDSIKGKRRHLLPDDGGK